MKGKKLNENPCGSWADEANEEEEAAAIQTSAANGLEINQVEEDEAAVSDDDTSSFHTAMSYISGNSTYTTAPSSLSGKAHEFVPSTTSSQNLSIAPQNETPIQQVSFKRSREERKTY